MIDGRHHPEHTPPVRLQPVEQVRAFVVEPPGAIDFEGRELHVTASFGVAEFGGPAKTSRELIRLADETLYDAKENGRNRVACAPATDGGDSPGKNQPVNSERAL